MKRLSIIICFLCLCAGGDLAGRYLENQIPYFGHTRGYARFYGFTASPQLDIRVRLGRKTAAGPLKLGAAWSSQTKFGAYFAFGFDF